MAITTRVGTVAESNSLVGTTGLSITPHASTAENDFMLLFSHRNDDAGDFDTPSGWTRLTAIDGTNSTGDQFQTGIFWKWAGASESAVTLTHTDTGAEEWSGVIVSYVGVDQTTPLDVTPTSAHYRVDQNKSSPNTDAFPQITTTINGALVVCFEAITKKGVDSASSLMGRSIARFALNVDATGDTYDGRQMMLWSRPTPAGAIYPGVPEYTSGTNEESSMATIALRPAAEYTFPLGRGAFSEVGSRTSPYALPLPAVATDDLVLIVCKGTANLSTPTGYTELINNNFSGSDRLQVWYRIVDGSESYTGDGTDTISFTWGTGSQTLNFFKHTIGSVDTGQPPSASSVSTGASTAPDPPSLSPGGTKDFLWMNAIGVDGGTITDSPSGYSGTWWSGTGGVAHRWVNASSDDPGTWTLSTSRNWAAVTLAIWPAPSAVDYTETATDGTGVTDSATAAKTGLRTATDPAAVSDTTIRSVAAERTATDSAGVTDTVGRVTALTRTVTEAVGATDATTRTADVTRTVTETVGVVDEAVKYSRVQGGVGFDGPPFTPPIPETATVAPLTSTVTDAVGVTDQISRVTASQRTVTDSVGVADTVVTARTVVVVVTDPVGATDIVDGTVFSGEAPTITDTVGVADSVVRVTETVRTVTGTVTVTDQPLVVHDQTRVSVDPVAVTDTVEASRGIGAIATDGVGVSDTVTVVQQTAYAETVPEPVTVTDSVDRVTETTRTVTEPVGVVDEVSTTRVLVVVITDTVGATDTPQGAKTTQVTVTETVNTTDDVIQAFGFGRTITEPVTGTDSVERVHLALRTITEAVDVSESVGSVSFGDYFWDRRPRTHTPNPALHTPDQPSWSPDGVTYTTDEPAYTSLTPDGPAWS